MLENNYVRELKNAILLVLLIGLFFLCYKLPFNAEGKFLGINWNILSYLVTLVISFILFLIMEMMSIKANKKVIAIALLLESIYIYITFAKESDIFDGASNVALVRGQVDHKVFAIIIFFASLILERIIVSYKANSQKTYRIIGNILVSAVAAMLSYSANPFKDEFGHLYHNEAYISSIINISNLVPYADNTIGVYGHYGIILLPFVKLFGNDLFAIMLTISIVVFLIHFLFGYIINSITDNDLLYYIGIIAMLGMATVYRPSGNYFQVYPHRVLFPMIALAWIVFTYRSNLKGPIRILVEVLIGTLAIIWNIESGIACILSMVAVDFLNNFQWKLSVVIRKIVLAAGILVGSFILGYILVNVYNILCGGSWGNIGVFIYPLGSESYMYDTLHTPFEKPIFYYVLYIWVFCMGVFPVAINQFRSRSESQNLADAISLATGVSGLLSIVYFINRQAFYNVTIAYFQLIILLFCGAQRYLHSDLGRYSVNWIAIIAICAISIEAFFSLGRAVDSRQATVWESDSLERDAENLEPYIIQDNSAVVGKGASIFCKYAGIDQGIYITDIEDLVNYDYLTEEITTKDVVYVTSEVYNEMAAGVTDAIIEILDENGFYNSNTYNGENIILREYIKE